METGNEEIWQYSADLTRFAEYLCRHHEDGEDVAQNALLKAAVHLDGFRGESSVRTWLHSIATNECRMLRRRKVPSSLDSMFDAVASDAALPADQPGPEELALESELRRGVVAAVAQLPEREQHVLVLKDGLGLKATEVAELLDVTVPAAKSVLFRARRHLRDSLDERGEVD